MQYIALHGRNEYKCGVCFCVCAVVEYLENG